MTATEETQIPDPMERLTRHLKSQSAGSEAAMSIIQDSGFAHIAAGDGLPIPDLTDMASNAPALAAPAETINQSTGASQAETMEPTQDRRAPTASLTTAASHRIPLDTSLLSHLNGIEAYQPIDTRFLDGVLQGTLNAGQWQRLHGQLDAHLAANMEDSGGFFGHHNIKTALLTPTVVYKDAGTPPAATAHRDNATSAGGLKEGMTLLPW